MVTNIIQYSHFTIHAGLVVVSIVMGIAISAAGEEGKFLLKLFQSIADVMMKVQIITPYCDVNIKIEHVDFIF